METIEEIQQALESLPLIDRLAIARWLRDFDTTVAEAGAYRVEEARPAYAASEPPFMTLEEFLLFEEKSPIQHEYVDGVVFAMAGPSVAHERIRHQLVMALGNHLSHGPCQVFSSAMQFVIRRDASEICYHPDIMVAGEQETWGANFVRNPKLVIEVLSPSTHVIDRREKLQNYRRVDSVEEYVLVAQDDHKLTIYPRADGWQPRIYTGPQAVAVFRSVELALPLIEIYCDVLAG